MFNNILKNLSILKKFLLINFLFFTVIGLFTFIYLKNVQPNLIKKKSSNHIEVINNKLGKPKINISKKVRTFIKKKFKLDKPKIYVSLSDENKHSIAYVIIENT